MTDREPTAPADAAPPPGKVRTAPPPGGLLSNARPEPAPRGDHPPMTLTLAPRLRTAHADGAHADPARALLARLADGSAESPAFAPTELPAAADHHAAEVFAAARAAACPDLFVVHAPDHLAGERVIADAARSSPGRTLVLSPNPAA